MKKLMKFLLIAAVFSFAACTERSADEAVNVKVKAVEQVQNYTYLLVKGRGPAYWIAVSSTGISPGERITYTGGLLMEDFYSKDLDRTFEKVIFLDGFEESEPEAGRAMMPGTSHGSAVKTERLGVRVEAEEGIVSIAELYENPAAYEGKMIRVKGEVAKVNMAIMERNWIHIQDGTEYEGKYDLTITSQESFDVGQLLSFEGILALNRDFGYGYTYELILENATAAK